MAAGTAQNEVPSCNLLLSPHAGWRYPESGGAEDHWLVASLLLNHPDRGAVQADGFYADYTLGGAATQARREAGRALSDRRRIAEAAAAWTEANDDASDGASRVLGYGREGVVRLVSAGETGAGGLTQGGFPQSRLPQNGSPLDPSASPDAYPGSDLYAEKEPLRRETLLLVGAAGRARALAGAIVPGAATPSCPNPRGEKRGDGWTARYPYERTEPFQGASPEAVRDFLTRCLERRVVCQNVKRANLRTRPDGGLLSSSTWARTSSPWTWTGSGTRRPGSTPSACWDGSDSELRRRPSSRRQTDVLREIPGFEDFYAGLLEFYARSHWARGVAPEAAARRLYGRRA